MNIFFVPSWYPTEKNQIGGVFFKELAEAFRERGVNITVIVPRLTNIPQLDKNTIQNGIRVYEIFFSVDYRIEHLWKQSLYLHRNRNPITKWIIEKFNLIVDQVGSPDILHAHSVFIGGYFCEILNDTYKIPYIITEHASFITSPKFYYSQNKRLKTKLSSILNRFLHFFFIKKNVENVYSTANYLVCVSRFQQNLLKKNYHFDTQSCVISNMVNQQMFKVKKNGKNKNFFIVSIGGLNHGKRFDKLIKAVLYIIPEYNNIKLIIVGEGKQRKELEKLIGEKYEYISLVGQKTKPDIISLFKKADLFVSTSDFETFGVACAEALSTGTPVVGYDNGGINDIITSSQYGVILKNNSVLSFRKAIINYIKNKDFYNSDLIREEAERLFHPNQIFDKYNHLYSEILKNK